MKTTIQWTKFAGAKWSNQLRLNALWSVWFAYLLGSLLAQRTINWPHFVLDTILLISIALLSALWNDWADKDIDKANQRKHAWHTINSQSAKYIMVVSLCIAGVCALLDNYRLIYLIAILPLGYLYNAAKWSHKPIASLILYALYYRIGPMILGLAATTGDLVNSYLLIFIAGWFLIRFGVGMYKDVKDIHGDRLHAKTTFIIYKGVKQMSRISFVLWLIGGALTTFALYNTWEFSPFILAVILFSVATLMRINLALKPQFEYQHKHFGQAFRAENFFLLSLILILLFSR